MYSKSALKVRFIDDYSPDFKKLRNCIYRSKTGNLNLLSDQDIHAMFLHRKGKEMFTKHLKILLVSKL